MKDGTTFRGRFINGIKNGYGEFIWSNGDSYQGNLENNKMHGFGQMNVKKRKNRNSIKGSKTNKNEGYIYRGNFYEGRKHGEGIIKYDNGDIYDGHFHLDKFDGPGKYTQSDGKVLDGIWRRGKIKDNGKLYSIEEIQ